MATIILNGSSPASFTPQDGDIYILENSAQGTFVFNGDADFEVQLSDSGPYGQGYFGDSAVNLNFEGDTSPTVTVGDDVNAGAVRINGNGDSLDVNVGSGSTTGVIAGDGANSFGDGLNPDGGGLTVNFADGSTVSNSIFGPTGLAPDGGADANYTFGNDVNFTSAAQVTGSVGGSTDITVGNNASFGAGSGLYAPAGELNGDSQTITVGDNMTGGGVTVAGSNGEKTMIIGDNADIGGVSFGSYGSNANPQFTADTGGTLIAGDNFNTVGWIYGAQTESTIIIGDGWNTQISLDGQNDNTALNADPVDTVRLGSPELFFDNSTGAVFGSGNDLISVRPPEGNLTEQGKWIGDAVSAGWEKNDDGSWSPSGLSTNYIYDTSYSGWSGAPAPLEEDPDGVVDGENGSELMGEGYDDSDGATDSGGDIIDGADGDNDVILGNGGDDNIQAGAGDDEVYGGSGNDVIDGDAGNDTLTGDFADGVKDVVTDNSTVEGDDVIEGGAGDDIIYGDSGNSLSAGGEGVPGDTLGDGPGSTGGYDGGRTYGEPVSDGNHSFTTDAFYLGNDIPILDGGDRAALVGVSFSQDGVGTDRTFGLDELSFTGAQRSFVGLVTVQDSDLSGATDQFSSSISGGFQDTTVLSSGTADFTMNDGQVFEGIRVNFVRGPDGETYMVPDDGPTPSGFNAFRNMLATNDSGIASFTIATGSGADTGINPIEGNWGDGQFFENTDGDGGDDTIIGGEGADTMFGEGGDDTFIVSSASEGAGGVISGGNGPDDNTDNDVLDLRGADVVTIDAVADDNDAGAQSGTVTFADGSTLTFEGIETILEGPLPDGVVDGEETGETMDVGYDDSNLPTDGGGDLITDGDDSIEGNGGDDIIDAGAGNDTIDGGADNDSITGGAGNDSITGGDGADTVVGGEGDDILDGGDGDDDIAVGGGDAAYGGLGDDVFTLDPTDTNPDVDVTIDGGRDGTDGAAAGPENGDEGDVLDLGDQMADLDVVLTANPETGTVDGLDADGTPDIKFDEIEKIITGSGDDEVDGGDALTPIDVETGEGDDSVTGGSGNDTIVAGPGDDTVSGGDGDDSIEGGDGTDTLTGGEGADTLDGGGDDDDLIMGVGDVALGGDGDDVFTVDPTLDEGPGVITVVGGEVDEGGADTSNDNYPGASGPNGDILDLRGLEITDFSPDGGDPASESGSITFLNDAGDPITVNYSEIEEVLFDPLPDGVVDGEETGEVMDVGYDDGNLPTDGGGDLITDGDDSIEGNGGDDIITAGGGNDTIDGGADNDTIDGGLGDDSIAGGTGDDSIIGGDGSDVVEGGDGNDVIDTSGPVDVNNGAGTPDIGYPGIAPSDSDPLNDLDTVFGGAGNDIINTGDDADSIYGGTGNDTIDAGIDADTIDGGDGDDRIVGGEGADTIEGGDGNDTIFAGNDPDLGLDQLNIEDDGSNPFGPDLAPNNGTDLVYGGAGNDTIFGADDADELFGGTGADVLDGGIDNDSLFGDDGNDTLIGGQGADEMFGGFGDDRFIVDQIGDGTNDVIVGGEDPDGKDIDVLDLTGSDVASIVYTNDDPASESGVVNFADGSTLKFSEIETVIPCFTPGTLIATSKGERLIEELQAGDRVITRDNGFQEIAWVGTKPMSGLELAQRPNLKPIFVKAGSFGDGLPERDMMLSPNHKVLLTSNEAELYFEEREVLVAAKHLIGKPGIQQVDVAQTTYIHFMFERHEVVLSDGAWTESFHPGDYSINGIDEAARNEILALFPELATEAGLNKYPLARTELKKREARLLIG